MVVRTCDSNQSLGMPSHRHDVKVRLALLFIKHQAMKEHTVAAGVFHA